MATRHLHSRDFFVEPGYAPGGFRGLGCGCGRGDVCVRHPLDATELEQKGPNLARVVALHLDVAVPHDAARADRPLELAQQRADLAAHVVQHRDLLAPRAALHRDGEAPFLRPEHQVGWRALRRGGSGPRPATVRRCHSPPARAVLGTVLFEERGQRVRPTIGRVNSVLRHRGLFSPALQPFFQPGHAAGAAVAARVGGRAADGAAGAIVGGFGGFGATGAASPLQVAHFPLVHQVAHFPLVHRAEPRQCLRRGRLSLLHFRFALARRLPRGPRGPFELSPFPLVARLQLLHRLLGGRWWQGRRGLGRGLL
mmetsp:Transcript_19440/g.44086  ORF Transcript_19440/g.44086 Transcript_19440/m.44086 type:complete len:311 (-) Transcript_19440:454-1386(-)